MIIQSTKKSLTDGEGENRITPNPKNIFFAKCKKMCAIKGEKEIAFHDL